MYQSGRFKIVNGLAAAEALVLQLDRMEEGDIDPNWSSRLQIRHGEKRLDLDDGDFSFEEPYLKVDISKFGLHRGERIMAVLYADEEGQESRLELFIDGGGRLLGEDVDDIVQSEWGKAFGILYGIDQSLTSLSQGSAAAAGGEPQQYGGTPGSGVTGLVQRKIGEVLGWQPRTGDVRGFGRALQQAFTKTELRGVPTYRWTPRSYYVSADLSEGITGAQASLYTRAKSSIDTAKNLLDGLYSLEDGEDEGEDAQAEVAKRLAATFMDELLIELGRLGGPRIPQVDSLFFHLLGSPDREGPDEVAGRLGELRDRFDLASASASLNTIEDERNATNYRVLVDSLVDLRRSWSKDRAEGNFELSNSSAFLGTQLVWLERGLWVVAESVGEVRAALLSLQIGPSEQRSLQLFFPDPPPDGGDLTGMSLDDLLSWIHRFASELGPRIVREGGRSAIDREFSSTVEELLWRVNEARNLDAQRQRRSLPNLRGSAPQLPLAFGYHKVQSALEQLGNHLQALASPQHQRVRGELEAPGEPARTTTVDVSAGPAQQR